MTPHQRTIAALARNLSSWFRAHARDLPWRRTADPYAIWISEIMLQQTQVKTVIPYWTRWMEALPTLEALARARPDQVMKLWEGLGYYRRARNLQSAAQVIMASPGGRFPAAFADILELPGIGRYTAGAISSIAFNQPTPVLDGNVIRILCRLFDIAEPPKTGEVNRRLWDLATELVTAASKLPDPTRTACSHLNQALMELGAMVCTPRQPQCGACPVRRHCQAVRAGTVEQRPAEDAGPAAIAQRWIAFIVCAEQRCLVRQRPEGGVNAGFWEYPLVECGEKAPDQNSKEGVRDSACVGDTGSGGCRVAARRGLRALPRQEMLSALFRQVTGLSLPAAACAPLGSIRHAITRYRMTIQAYRVELAAAAPVSGARWVEGRALERLPLTGITRKLRRLAGKKRA